MDEEELEALTLNPTPEPTPPPPPMLAPLPTPPPIAPIPTPPPAALLRTSRAPSSTGSDSERESSAPPHSIADYEISDASRQARERQERAVQELLLKRRAFAMAVPTNDSAVRARLRRLGEPITLFGEREMERRDRLRNLMVKLEAEGHLDRLLRAHDEEQTASAASQMTEDEESAIQYPFYTEGSKELHEARVHIAKYSMARAAARLERAKQRRDNPDEDVEAEAQYMVKQASGFVLECSEIGDDRPLSGCSFSYDGSLLATRLAFCSSLVYMLCPVLVK